MGNLCRDRLPLYFHITLSCIERIKRAVICIQVERGKKYVWFRLCLLQQAFPPPHRPGLRVSLAPLRSEHFHKGLFHARMRRHLTSCFFQLVNHLKLVGMRKDREEFFPLALLPPDLKDMCVFCLEHKAYPVRFILECERNMEECQQGGRKAQ